MKTLSRLIIILAVALAVVAITYGVSQSTWGTQQLGVTAGGDGHGRPDMNASLAGAATTLDVSVEELSAALGGMPPDYAGAAATLGLAETDVQAAVDASLAASFGARPDGAGEDRGNHESGFSPYALTTFARILLPVVLVIVAVSLLRSLFGWLKRRRTPVQPVPAR